MKSKTVMGMLFKEKVTSRYITVSDDGTKVEQIIRAHHRTHFRKLAAAKPIPAGVTVRALRRVHPAIMEHPMRYAILSDDGTTVENIIVSSPEAQARFAKLAAATPINDDVLVQPGSKVINLKKQLFELPEETPTDPAPADT